MMGSEAIEADVSVAPGAFNVAGASGAGAGATGDNSHQDVVDAKIMADLEMLTEKCDLCESMLRPGSDSPAPSVQTDEACQSVIGFLEACAPRMVELVEAAAQGAVSDVVLMKALEVNDKLTKQLADIDTVALTETPASTTAASASASGSSDDNDDYNDDNDFAGVQDNLDDLLLTSSTDDDNGNGGNMFGDDDDSKKPAAAAAATKSTGEEDGEEVNDPFGKNTVSQPTSASGAPAPASTKSEEEFDDFFNDRTTS
jgi:hypothetical protein